MDDVLIFGSTKEEHDARLIDVLNKISRAGATLNKDKCLFGSGKDHLLRPCDRQNWNIP